MKLVTQIEIDRPLAEVMAVMADAANNTKWMHDLASYAPAKSGQSAQLAFKNGYVFTVSPLPNKTNELRSKLESKSLTIITIAHFKTISAQKTGLRFEQEFTFKGIGKLLSLMAQPYVSNSKNICRILSFLLRVNAIR